MTSRIVLPYSFYGGVREAMLDRSPEVIAEGPADTGKTLGMLIKLHLCAIKYAGAQISILRKIRADLIETVYQTWKRDVQPYSVGLRVYGGENPYWIDYPNGSRIWFGGLDKPERSLSAERDLIYVNQAEQISMVDWEYLIRATSGRGAVMPYTQVVGDCNPAHNRHWIPLRAETGSLVLHKTKHQDNPAIYRRDGTLTMMGQQRLARLGQLTGTRRTRLLLGLWAPPEGAIYDCYDEESHVVKAFDPPRLWPRFVGIDPFGAQIGAVWLAWDAQNEVLNVYREYLEPFGLSTPQHVVKILEASGYSAQGAPTGAAEPIYAWVGGGPSERQARTDWTFAGIPLLTPQITEVWSGIDRVQNLLHNFRLVIHDNCINLRSEISGYSRVVRDGMVTDAIENKEAFHLLDALRYIVSWLSEPTTKTETILRLPTM